MTDQKKARAPGGGRPALSDAGNVRLTRYTLREDEAAWVKAEAARRGYKSASRFLSALIARSRAAAGT